jgi:Putative peptidoglycan binding domain
MAFAWKRGRFNLHGKIRHSIKKGAAIHPMKSPFIFLNRIVKAGIVAAVCLIALPLAADAKGPKEHKNNGKGHGSGNQNTRKSGHDDHDRQYYTSRPRSTFVLSLGTGYAGRGYYYGPANSSYYYQRSDVRYFATREAAPREYYGNEGYGNNAAVQRELSRRGYYNGSIDGAIGPKSSRAIARYQRDNGLRQSGTISQSLLRSLGLQ